MCRNWIEKHIAYKSIKAHIFTIIFFKISSEIYRWIARTFFFLMEKKYCTKSFRIASGTQLPRVIRLLFFFRLNYAPLLKLYGILLKGTPKKCLGRCRIFRLRPVKYGADIVTEQHLHPKILFEKHYTDSGGIELDVLNHPTFSSNNSHHWAMATRWYWVISSKYLIN